MARNKRDAWEAHVDRRDDDECWPWTGRTDREGYGVMHAEGRFFFAHRASFAIHKGDPIGVVRHTCDNPPCQNPRHLLDGTQADNVRDRENRGRGVRPVGCRHGMAKLDERRVREARRMAAEGLSYAAIGRHFGVSYQAIMSCVNGRTWRHVK